MSVVDQVRAQRKNPNVLRLKILKIRGEDPTAFVFVFEGVDDVAVYEEWIRRIIDCPEYESVPAAGKEQILSLARLSI